MYRRTAAGLLGRVVRYPSKPATGARWQGQSDAKRADERLQRWAVGRVAGNGRQAIHCGRPGRRPGVCARALWGAQVTGRALILALFWALLSLVGLGCSGQLATRAHTGAVVLGGCVAACAAGCIPDVLSPGTGSARAERYGRCLAPCSAACIPPAAKMVFENPPKPCLEASRPRAGRPDD